MDETNFIIGLFESLPEENRSSKINEALELLQAQRNDLSDDLNALKKDEREINRMKEGSIAKIEQLTTISKMRIYVPKKSTDFLAGIRFSQNAMSRINAKIKELYIFDE